MKTGTSKKSKTPMKSDKGKTPTIISMFKQQVKRQSSCKGEDSVKLSNSDSDIEITAIETESKYFGEKSPLKKSWSDAAIKGTIKTVTRRLSLKKRKSVSNELTDDKNRNIETASLSQKENSEQSNTAVSVSKNRLSLSIRKRKSSGTTSEEEYEGKKTKKSADNFESTSGDNAGRLSDSYKGNCSQREEVKCNLDVLTVTTCTLNEQSQESQADSKISFKSLKELKLSPEKGMKIITHLSDKESSEDNRSDRTSSCDIERSDICDTESSESAIHVHTTGERTRKLPKLSLGKEMNIANKMGKYNKSGHKEKDQISHGTPNYTDSENSYSNPGTSKDSVTEVKKEDEKSKEEEEEEEMIQTPYYLENFRTILKTELDDEDNLKLYSQEDTFTISNFHQLSDEAQKLYVRLFGRKWAWLAVSRIRYPGIAEDLTPIIKELTITGFLLTDSELTELEPTLNLLPASDVKSLAKTYHLNVSLGKKELIPLLVKKSKENTIGSMFKVAGHNAQNIMLKRAKKMLGGCLRLMEEPRKVFIRTLMLFSLTDTVLDEDMANGQATQLFRMLQVNIGAVLYPTYSVNKQTQIFPDREALLSFSEASILEAELWTKLERNNWKTAYDVYMEAEGRLTELMKDSKIEKSDKSLPVFLRPYTPAGVYMRILNQGVEVLQRRKEYSEAVCLLERLLGQETYCTDYRGHWWERLALNYDAHLKNLEKALKAAENGLKDKHVRVGRRLALYLRAEKICTAPKSKFLTRMKKIPNLSVEEAPKVYIDGTVLSDNVPGQKYKFMIPDPDGDSEDITFCGVEQLVLEHYKQNGYPEGLHAEGSIISNLFGMFFWDIIFMDIPDAFHSPYQTHPLDMYSEVFYQRRKADIDRQIDLIKNSSDKDLDDLVAKVWEKNFSVLCIGLNWELFRDLDHLQGLIKCFGGQRLASLLQRYTQDPRHTRSGFPDLTLWNPQEGTLKISEVKGPGDRLSHKQILWIDYLLQCGVDAEVCHVKAVSSKRLVASTT